ncbi:MAG: hypothetical protein IKY59_03890 [Oscillospiraceae bacterium]|nr:hypothetical protein [Oscillospiraceae bacterium]
MTLLLAVVHIWMPFAANPWNWIVNFLPLVIVTALVVWRGSNAGVFADTVAILLAAAQGILWGVTGAAVLGLIGCSWSPWYLRYPYDEVAFAIISLTSVALIAVIFIMDLVKHNEINSGKRMFLQFCIGLSLALPVIVPAIKLMEYCEGILSQFVS